MAIEQRLQLPRGTPAAIERNNAEAGVNDRNAACQAEDIEKGDAFFCILWFEYVVVQSKNMAQMRL